MPQVKPRVVEAPRKQAAPKPTPRATSAPAPRKGPVTPAEARRHFEELLKAKQERVRQGPNYPPANAYTGRHDGDAPSTTDASDEAPAPQTDNTPAPEATYGETHTHGRGNQGMRNQK
ncbi:MAG: hypothetical protein ACREPX_07170 [Rhodanobacteraceae bacterium]